MFEITAISLLLNYYNAIKRVAMSIQSNAFRLFALQIPFQITKISLNFSTIREEMILWKDRVNFGFGSIIMSN